ncbi:endolytic transglycosylase MltG [Occallatibacter riparius]|uniref:Endolytic murein transglycosylase n=1 Tax=Occallatibacter riparius TaxID=1002689 RepID=A0A9J7BNT9_9BACT|nr:endolytic transglycosylase MltG [Occallatibacter riparius]UWZ84287.1 endolytic transglycosylase MltG [Occallatibacter riparius]
MASRRRSTAKGRGSWGRVVFAVFLLAILAAAGFAAFVLYTPYGPQQETFVEVLPGSSTMRIARQLEGAGIIRSQYAFYVERWLQHGSLKAGDYRFDHPAPVSEIYDRIRRGDTYAIAVTIPEGSTMFDIGARLEQAGFGPAASFVNVARQESGLLSDIDPQAKTLEGYLFPDTYKIGPKEQMPQIAALMVKRFRQAALQLGLNHNVHQVVTLASIVERETAIDGERPLVASVFENRLDKQMPLMTDPAVIYGLQLQNAWRGTIYASDLQRDTPYNTYMHPGLPPGPIANPGIKSLKAAMQPAQTDYLYFVAASKNPQGKSLFAATLEEHNRNVAGYRDAVKKEGNQ